MPRPIKGKFFLHDLARINPQVENAKRFVVTESRTPEKTMILKANSRESAETSRRFYQNSWRKSQ